MLIGRTLLVHNFHKLISICLGSRCLTGYRFLSARCPLVRAREWMREVADFPRLVLVS